MAWTLDTSGLLVSDGNVVTEEGQPKGDSKANAMWVDNTDSNTWRFEIKGGKNMWIGVAREDKFGPGYSMKGLFYGGPGNLSDGGSLVTSGWGPKFLPGDLVDMRLTLSGDNLKLEFNVNNSYLGPAFNIDGWSGDKPKPVISFSSKGSSVAITNLDTFSTSAAATDNDAVTGDWSNAEEGYNLSLNQEGSSNIYNLSLKVANSMGGKVEKKEDGTWAMIGSMFSTQMMPPPEKYELEKKLGSLYPTVKNFARAGSDLVVSFGDDAQHRLAPQPRPEPATKDKINWMRS